MDTLIKLEVCEDCHYVHHTAELPPDADPKITPWSMIEDTTRVTDWSVNTDEEESHEPFFTFAACDGCGSQLGGMRHVYAYHDED